MELMCLIGNIFCVCVFASSRQKPGWLQSRIKNQKRNMRTMPMAIKLLVIICWCSWRCRKNAITGRRRRRRRAAAGVVVRWPLLSRDSPQPLNGPDEAIVGRPTPPTSLLDMQDTGRRTHIGESLEVPIVRVPYRHECSTVLVMCQCL